MLGITESPEASLSRGSWESLSLLPLSQAPLSSVAAVAASGLELTPGLLELSVDMADAV